MSELREGGERGGGRVKRGGRWTVETLKMVRNVDAQDQWEAYDSFMDMPVEQFGLMVVATPESGNPKDSIAVRTSMLMFRWGRRLDAHLFLARAMAEGFPDTSALDDSVRRQEEVVE